MEFFNVFKTLIQENETLKKTNETLGEGWDFLKTNLRLVASLQNIPGRGRCGSCRQEVQKKCSGIKGFLASDLKCACRLGQLVLLMVD